MSISDIVETTGWKKFMAKLYGWGATVVIIGALFKINHWPGGSLVITIGMAVEAIIFFFSAFEPLHEEIDWTLVYPELAGVSEPEDLESFKARVPESSHATVSNVQNVVGIAGIDDEAMKKIGESFNRLGDSANSIADISGATVATKEFVTNLQTAANSVSSFHESANSIKESTISLTGAYSETADNIRRSGGEIAESYKGIADSIKQGFSSIATGSQEYEKQINELSKNVASLNDVYASQIKDTMSQLQGSKELYGGLHEMISNLKASVDETNKYKEEITKLKESISSLNNIYGNMLNTMNPKSKA